MLIERYLNKFIINDLKKKMVFLSGPRQSGKSTLAKNIFLKNEVEYLNWDIHSHKKIILKAEWDKEKKVVILDELHKLPKWKSFLKGIYDEYQNKQSLLITGSAKLDTFKYSGDALTGRFYSYRLHPIDTVEAVKYFSFKNSYDATLHILNTGGFPEAFLDSKNAPRIQQDRLDLVLQEDLRDISKVNSISLLYLVIEILRDNVGQLISMDSIAKSVGVSIPTIKAWLDLLERLYLIFKVTPFSHKLSRSLKKESKYYFYDCSLAVDKGGKIENLVACSLLKYCHFKRDTEGLDLKLFFFRDKEKHEVDFIIANRNNPIYFIEVKSKEDVFSKSLYYLHNKIHTAKALQFVLELDKNKEKDGLYMQPIDQGLLKIWNSY